jgi:LmbE family N-acetylglucosaminyl deacetylase
VLVVATHPDDEVLTAGGALSELVAGGAKVRVVIVTAGDGYASAARIVTPGPLDASAYLALGNARYRESTAAARSLGLLPADVIRLGYSDASGAVIWDTSWDAARAFTGRNGSPVVPYAWAQRPGAAQCGSSVAQDLAAQVREFDPDTVISPDTRETNTDHAAVAAFTMFALDDTGFDGMRLTAVVHFKGFPLTWANTPQAALAPPPQLLGDGATWLALPLDAAAERAKAAALDDYRSQLGVGDLSVYMHSFVRRNELFSLRPASTAARATTDAIPAGSTEGTIAVTPPPVIAPSEPNPAKVVALRMVRGPQRVWFGMVCASPATSRPEYRLDLRLMGAGAPSARLVVVVRDGRPEVVRPSDDCIAPEGVTAARSGDTLWVSVPASVLAGRTAVIAGSSSLLKGFSSARSPWVDVRL